MTAGVRLPERLGRPDRLLLRRLIVDDAETIGLVVAESVEHLRPWLSWIADEPLPLEERCAALLRWEREWISGDGVRMGVFLGDRMVGGCGLHTRDGLSGLHVGYWTHPAFVGRGLATTAAGLLTDAALAVERIAHVEIHHDKANVASSSIPRKLGYVHIEDYRREPVAPADSGVACRWRAAHEWHDCRAAVQAPGAG